MTRLDLTNLQWRLAADPDDRGLAANWHRVPPTEAQPASVPGPLQVDLPGVHGIVWFWCDLPDPAPVASEDRVLLRFWAVDHRADVWLAGSSLGRHEGGETPFEFDLTNALSGGPNDLLALRVVVPTPDRIDGLRLQETAHRNRAMPFVAGASFNLGGILDSVELFSAPSVSVETLWAHGEPGGEITVQATLNNAGDLGVNADLEVDLTPANGGVPLLKGKASLQIVSEESAVVTLTFPSEGLETWELHRPALYLARARLLVNGTPCHERSARFGIRDFRFANGRFELNGRALFVRMTHTVNDYPLVRARSTTIDHLRKDMLHLKAMGFNMVRFIWGGALQTQLDLCDEIGLLVYQESYASWSMDETSQLKERFEAAIEEVIRRDRTHPSIVIWGLLNEAEDSPAFRCAVDTLGLAQRLDGTRVVFLNSGRLDGRQEIRSAANPGSDHWDIALSREGQEASPAPPDSWPMTDAKPLGTPAGLGDFHFYPRVPHTQRTIEQLRNLGGDAGGPLFVTEYGTGSAVDLWRVARQYEEAGATASEDATFYATQLARFEGDWQRWKLEEVFGHPSEFFRQSMTRMARERIRGISALRANPGLIGYGLTGAVDQVMCGEGLFTTFRDLKPGAFDAVRDALAPMYWCLFLDQEVVQPTSRVRVEALLANDHSFRPGVYPVEMSIVAPTGAAVRAWSTSIDVPNDDQRVLPVIDETFVSPEQPGTYRVITRLTRGGAPTGGEGRLTVLPPCPQFRLPPKITVVDERAYESARVLGVEAEWAELERIKPGALVLCCSTPDQRLAEALRDSASHGGVVVSVLPLADAETPSQGLDNSEALAVGDARAFPLLGDAHLRPTTGWLYQRDDWGRNHPFFDGLSPGLLDYGTYANVLSDWMLELPDGPSAAETTVIAGGIKASQGYASGVTAADVKHGRGRIIVTTFALADCLPGDAVATRLFGNLLAFASSYLG